MQEGEIFKLESALDSRKLQLDFARLGYVHIPGILAEPGLSDLYRVMQESTAWNLCFNDGKRHIDIAPESLAAMNAEQYRRLQEAVLAQAQKSFQYLYYNYPIYDACKAGLNKGHLLHRFYEWLNSEEFLQFARQVTACADISFADAQATRFGPGHFLKCHDDDQLNKNRRAAYIFNFTPDWDVDWGGYLQLLDDRQHIRRGIRPLFNSLNIIAVPQPHNVSYVAPYARGKRYAITGWLRYGEPD